MKRNGGNMVVGCDEIGDKLTAATKTREKQQGSEKNINFVDWPIR